MSEGCLYVYVGVDTDGCPVYSLTCDGFFIGGGRMLTGNECTYWSERGPEIVEKMNKPVSRYEIINADVFDSKEGGLDLMNVDDNHLEALSESLSRELKKCG
jgi:hypothetical protein